ncbi:hypothetical protein GCM10010329_62210 [Streptomyces spiroverticillatus]|uniref:Alkaline shock response membrane anchor protein AmaP n=1 Tax=Streptomyces finlayi TaxID=67296 RepID=A0A918X606_9ACTN|nr:alkaline shock response membrane anchor protein AmaP [Streptomyces finlayi]GHA30478.1 hypothetical protein GCM10010329_62210 [Streptomyces spiroverticillatus]GHD14793.1 hypothetical protein GCM10010334_74220 [Streptomyces finlayi]
MTPVATFLTRAALLLLSLGSLAAGLWLVLGHLAVRPVNGPHVHLPSWWPLPRTEAGAAGAHGWWAPSVLTALSIAVLLGMAGLCALSVRASRTHAPLPLGGAGVSLRSHALKDALASQTSVLPGVRAARIALRPVRGAQLVRVTLWLEQGSAPEGVLRNLETGPLAMARAALAPLPVRAEVRLRARRRRSRRTR